MRRITFLLPLLCLLAAFEACKPSRNNATPAPAASEYLKLTPGNYWVYESYYVDSNGTGGPGSEGGGAPYHDSVYVAADTTFGGHTWHTLMQPEPGTSTYTAAYLRDSLNYEVNSYGRIVLAPTDYSHVLYTRTQLGPTGGFPDSALVVACRMGDKDKVVNVPAGSFTTIGFITAYNFYPFAGGSHTPARAQYARYAAGVGMVSQTLPFYYADPMYVEERLLRYHVQ